MRLSEFEVVVDGMLAISDNKFDVGDESTETGGNPDNDVSVAAIPQLAMSSPLGELFEGGDRFAVGLGFAVPTGFGSDYGNDWAGRYLAQESTLVFLNIQPVVAARVTDWLSIGAGAAIVYVDSSTKVAVNNGPGLDDGRLKLDLDGLSAGPVVSVLLEPSLRLRFGAVWRGEVEPELEGRAKFSDLSPARETMLEDLGLIDAKVDLGMRSPQAVQVGGYYEVTPELALMGDFAWVDWSRFGTVDIAVSDFSTTTKTDYKDIWIGSVGAEYRFNERWKGALGFTYISSAISDSDRTLAFPLDELFITGIGATFELNEEVELHGNFLITLGGDTARSTRVRVSRAPRG